MRSLLRKYTLPGLVICVLGLLGLWGLFVYWLYGSDYSAAAYIAAFFSAVLFALVCLRFVPGWMRFWSRGGYAEAERVGGEPARIRPRIFLGVLLWALGVFLIIFAVYCVIGYSPRTFLNFWTLTDAQHYLDIARDWYLSEGSHDRLVQLVFLPGYPLAVRAVQLLVRDWVIAGMLVSVFSFAGACCVIYSLLRLDYPHETSLRCVKYLCLVPGSFFFIAPMSESLFLLLSALCVYLARRGRYGLGCLFGACAAFTRSLGLMLFVPVCMELVHELANAKRGRARLLWLLLIPAGFGAYICINYLVSGNPFQYMVYQSEHWGQRFGFFFATAGYQTENAIASLSNNLHNFLGLWLPNIVFDLASLGVMAWSARRMRPSYAAWFIAYYVIAIGATWLLSAPRYLISLLPFILGLTLIAATRRRDNIMTLICIPLWLYYAAVFTLRWQVW